MNQTMSESFRVLLLINNSGAYDRGLIKGIAQYAKYYDSWFFLRESPYFIYKNTDKKIIQYIKEWKPDGIIMCENDLANEIISLNIPTIISPFTKIYDRVINIVANDFAIGEMGAHYYLEKKYSHYAFYGTNESFWSLEREKAYVRTLKINHKEVSVYRTSILKKEFDWKKEPYHIARWLQEQPKPLALMACADDWSQLVTEAVKIAGLKAPEDIAILGVDNDELICELSSPPLSSIIQDSEKTGFEAAYLLHQLMKGFNVPVKNIVGLPIQVVTRQSTKLTAVENIDISNALRYINNNAGNQHLHVEQVVKKTCLSRRVLEIKFREYLGRTIGSEIKRTRINAVCEKLINTSLTISEIAEHLGFGSSANLTVFFKREKKTTPLEYRKTHCIKRYS